MKEEFKENIVNIENFEIMPVPKIGVKREPGIELLAGFLAEQKEPLEDNEEAMEWIALSYSHPEYKDVILNKIKKYKSFIKNPEELYEKIMKYLSVYEKKAPTLDVSDEVKKREEMIPKYKEHIEKSIEYFRPDIKTSDIQNVEIIPCDELFTRTETGKGIHMGNTSFIMSHTENPDNFDHEFLHGIINSITEKFSDYFESEEQRTKIFRLVGSRLKDYGDYPLSILNEEIIKTYTIYIKDGGVENILSGTRKKIELMIDNGLRKRLHSFYKEYESARRLDTFLSFEKYFSENYKMILD